ncbi:hypothetical protein [Bradyrhizobium sp. SEMIA]|uniref:hypothetical protein n=1 Tax=Bradyrhizobium sp. SEMIA TaxID=2597515 RepID=UPI0018A56FDB|nr:hypothetical protein [Bradyrhizobium sp. SEMIA]QOG19134.1 hypothetical protein FOM02_19060 [Bradyrhizobium sp. SEMIA]
MTDNSRLSKIIADLERALAHLKELELSGDVLVLIHAGHALTIDMAADVRECGSEWMRQLCERTELMKRPIGTKFGRDWIIDANRLLDWIEQNEGTPACAEAKARLRKYRL